MDLPRCARLCRDSIFASCTSRTSLGSHCEVTAGALERADAPDAGNRNSRRRSESKLAVTQYHFDYASYRSASVEPACRRHGCRHKFTREVPRVVAANGGALVIWPDTRWRGTSPRFATSRRPIYFRQLKAKTHAKFGLQILPRRQSVPTCWGKSDSSPDRRSLPTHANAPKASVEQSSQ